MKRMSLLLAAVLAGCGFGDNQIEQGWSSLVCGDGVLDAGEGCDDGNVVSGDGCTSDCSVETQHPVCGNGVRELGEACDDGNGASGDGCSPACEEEAYGDCSLITQQGCGSAQACDVTPDGGTECRGVTAMGTADSVCTSDTDCAAGYTCVTASSTIASCRKFCSADAHCGGDGARCTLELTENGVSLGVNVCSNACDAYPNTGCPWGMTCEVAATPAGNYTDCRPAGSTPMGSECFGGGMCSQGTTCLPWLSSVLVCVKYCALDGFSPTGCVEPYDQCTPFDPARTIGPNIYGYCR